MLDIQLAYVRGAEAVLVSLRDPGVVLEKVARQVGEVPPLAERLREVAASRSQRAVRNGQQAVLMLGCTTVERETRALVQQWLDAMESGGARLVSLPTPARAELPAHLQHWRRTSRGA